MSNLTLKKKKFIYDPVFLFMFFLCFVILIGFDESLMTGGNTYSNIVVPYINMNITIVMAAISIFSIILIVSNKNGVKFDKLIFILFYRVLIYFVPIIYISTGEFKLGIAFAVIETLLAYFIGKQYDNKIEYIVFILEFMLIVSSFQIFYTMFYYKLSFFAPDLKWHMVTPVGRYNYITCMILPCFYFLDEYFGQKYSNSKMRTINLLITFFAVLGTGSKLALLLFGIYVVFRFFKGITLKIRTRDILIVLAVMLLGIIFMNKVESSLFQVYQKYTSKNIFSSRLEVYQDCIELIFENPFWGRSAYSYKVYDSTRAHNFILESLIQTGIFGTLLYLIALIVILKNLSRIEDKILRNCFTYFICGFLIQGLAEPNLFGVTSDAFFWVICGVAISFTKDKYKRREINEKIINNVKGDC